MTIRNKRYLALTFLLCFILGVSLVIPIVDKKFRVINSNDNYYIMYSDSSNVTSGYNCYGMSQNDFSYPDNARTSDDVYATETTDNDEEDYGCFHLDSIPSGATIDGIEVIVEARKTSSWDTYLYVQVSDDNCTSWSTYNPQVSLTTYDITRTLGSSTELWGGSWDESTISDNLAVRVKKQGRAALYLDYIYVKVYYSEGWSNTAPSFTTPRSPANGATGQSLTPTLTINITDADGDDTTVDWYYSENNVTFTHFAHFTGHPANTTNSTTATFADSYNTKYYWKVYANDTHNNATSTVWNFTTVDYTPDAPVLTGATTLSSSSISISWTDDTEADSTYIEWDSVNDTSWNRGDHNDTGINSSSSPQTHSGLSSSTTYYYKAWSYNATQGVWSSGSSVIDNTTNTGWSNTPPTITNPNPSNGATGVSLTPTVNATVTDADGNTSVVNFYYSTDNISFSHFGTSQSGKLNESVSETASFATEYNKKYYWYITANDSIDNTTSSTWNFTTIDYTPSEPTNFHADNSTSGSMILTWTKDTKADNTIIERNQTGSTVWARGSGIEIYNGSSSTYTDSGLAYNTTYYYQAWSYNATQNVYSPNNASTSNTTGAKPNLLVSSPFPSNNSQTVLTGIGNLSVIINGATSWNISLYDNTTHTLQAYISDNSNTVDGVKYLDVSSALYYQFNKSFTWYVNATNGATWSNHTYYFTTFNGSGFIYKDNVTVSTNNLSSGLTLYKGMIHVLDHVDNDHMYVKAYDIQNSSLILIDTEETTVNDNAYGIDSGNFLHILVGSNIGTYIITYTFIGNSYTQKDGAGYGPGYTFYDMTVCSNGSKDRVFVTTDYDGGGITVVDADASSTNFADFEHGDFSKITHINNYVLVINSTTDDLWLFTYNESGNYQWSFKDTYAGTYNDVTSDGNYFYAVSDTSLDIFSINSTDKLVLEYSYVDSGISVTKVDDKSFIGSSNGKILSYIYEGGEFIEQQNTTMVNNSKSIYEMAGSGSYLVIAGEEGGLHLYGYELLRVAPPVIDIKIAGDPTQDSVTRDGAIRYVNQSYNNQTFCNVTANITIPAYRTLGRYFRTTDDDILIPSGNLTDGDTNYVNEGNHSFIASKYECTYTGEYSQISGYLVGSGMSPPWVSYAIYTDNDGEPGTLLGFTERDWPGSDVFTQYQRDNVGTLYYPPCTRIWFTGDIAYDGNGHPTNSITLTEGNDYWLVMATNDSYGYSGWGYTYSNDIYWLLANDLGDTCYVKTAPYNLPADMNFSNATGLVWSNATGQNGETPHYACIYAIANSTYNSIETVDIASATLHWYTDGVNNQNFTMTEIGSTNNWTYNVTGLTPGHWYTFDITAYDELNDDVTYEHYRYIVEGKTERIEFQCGVPTKDETYHKGYNSSSTLYRNETVLYLENRTYGTDTWYGDDEQMEDSLPHEQGVDGTADDTGGWVNTLPDDTFQARHCLKFAGAWWDENITIEDEITLNNVYVHWWAGGGVDWDSMRIHFGRMTTLYDFGWLELTEDIGGNWNYIELNTNSSTRESHVISNPPETFSDPSGVDNTGRLICEYINLSQAVGNMTFDSTSIYNFFIGYDNNGSLAWTKESAMILNNRSYLSFILFNIPEDIYNGIDTTTDSDSDGLSDWYEMNVSFTHPFLADTDGDGYNDADDGQPNNYEFHVAMVSNPVPSNNSNVDASLSELTIDITGSGSYDWNISCSNGQSNSSTGDSSGTKDLQVSGLSEGVTYTWWVNVTDGVNTVNNTYYFTVVSWNEVEQWKISFSNTTSNKETFNWIVSFSNTTINNQALSWNFSFSNTSTYNRAFSFNISFRNITDQEWNRTFLHVISFSNTTENNRAFSFNISFSNKSDQQWNRTSLFNISFSNTTSLLEAFSWNISFSNTSSFVQTSLFNISFSNTTSNINTFSLNISFSNISDQEWNQTSLFNISFSNTTTSTTALSWNISFSNTTIYTQTSLFNVSFSNTTTSKTVFSWNISFKNTTDQEFNRTMFWNISFSNTTTYKQVNQWNISFSNSSYSQTVFSFNVSFSNTTTLKNAFSFNVSFSNKTDQKWNQTSLFNISFSNTSNYKQLSLWNISFSNTSASTSVFSFNVSFSNTTSYNNVYTFNVSFSNTSDQKWNQTTLWNISFSNSTSYVQSNYWNVSFSNSSSLNVAFSWNISFSNTSYNTQIFSWNVSFSNISDQEWNQTNLWNISFSNTSSYNQNQLWNISFSNSSVLEVAFSFYISFSNTTNNNQVFSFNISFSNKSDQEWNNTFSFNISFSNTSVNNQVSYWNISFSNSSAEVTIFEFNISFSNTSTHQQVTQWNISFSNTSDQVWNETFEFNISFSNTTNNNEVLLWNISFSNSSSSTTIFDFNISFSNSTYNTQVIYWNISFSNTSTEIWSQVSYWNISFSNTSNVTSIFAWNISFSNTSRETEQVFNWIISFSNSSAVNITVYNPFPNDGAVHVKVPVTVGISIYHSGGYNMNITWYTNSSGSWEQIGSNTTVVPDGTYYKFASEYFDTYDKQYYWYVNVSDAHGNYTVSDYYTFSTKIYSQYTIKDTGTDSSTFIGVAGGLIVIPLIFIFIRKRRRR